MRRPALLILFACVLIAQSTRAQIDDTPIWQTIDSAYSLGFFAWSPDMKWIAYFTNEASEFSDGPVPDYADLHLRSLETGQTCVYRKMPLGVSYGGIGIYAWLPADQWLSLAKGGAIISPCVGTLQDISPLLPTSAHTIASISPDGQRILFATENGYVLYDLASGTVVPVSGITPNNDDGSTAFSLSANWSPDGTQIAAQINSTGSVYRIDPQTGAASLVYSEPKPTPISDGEGALPPAAGNKFDPSYGAPRWLTPDLLFITRTLSDGALIISTDGTILMRDGTRQILDAVRYGDTYRLLVRDLARYSVYYPETETFDPLDAARADGWGGYDFAPDGRMLLLSHYPQGANPVRREYLLGVEPLSTPGLAPQQRLVVNGDPMSGLWSPDASRYAFGVRNQIVLLEGQDFNAQQWINIQGADDARPEAWSPDGARLMVVAYDPQQEQVNLLLVTPR